MNRWAAVLLAAALVAACTDDDAAEPPAPGESTTSTADAVDRSGIALTPVAGETTTTIRETGTARLVGTVRGPDGLVPGAAVRIERLVAGREIRSDVTTGPDGRFELDRVPGGRYRVRAFLPPTLAQLEPELRFLADGEEHAFDLVVEPHQGLVVRSSAAPSPALRGRPVNVVVLVARRVVDGDGVVRTSPISGLSVELVGLGRWVLRDDGAGGPTTSTTSFSGTTSTTTGRLDATGRTDASGRVRFELSCRVTGPPGLAVRVPIAVAQPTTGPTPTAGGPSTTTTAPQARIDTIALELPACVEAPAATSTTTTTRGTTTEPTADDDG